MTDKEIKICGHGGGRPSIKVLYDYSQERYKKIASNGVHKGIVCVKRHKKMTDALRKKFVKTYDTIIGRNYYNQDRRSYVFTKYKDGKYYSDCSSSGMATMKKIGLNIGSWLLNTAAIYESNLFEFVDVTIKDGHITNPEVLKIGDCILFIGNDPSRPKQIGHVEYVYAVPEPKKEETPVTAVTTPAPFIGRVTANSLNIRKKASILSLPKGTYNKDKVVFITKVNGNWGYANNNGWISLKYVSVKSKVVGKVSAFYLNARKKPIDGDVVKVLKENTPVIINKINDDGTWGYDTVTNAWVSLKYIKF